jgi:hypothetical protein
MALEQYFRHRFLGAFVDGEVDIPIKIRLIFEISRRGNNYI